jgi:hypothetical protein
MPDPMPTPDGPSGAEPDDAEILSYFRGRISDPRRRQAVRDHLAQLPRWPAHRDSIRHIDLEYAAAVQDARDLRTFRRITPFCRTVASGERDPLIEGGDVGSARAWERHFDRCVFCRRTRRAAFARAEAARLGEPLLRDRLLRSIYTDALVAAAEMIRSSPPPTRVVLVLTAGGFAALVFDGTRTDLGPGRLPPSVGGWVVGRVGLASEVRMRSAAPPGGTVGLDFRRTLPDGRAALEVRLRVAFGELQWTAHLSDLPLQPVRLTVEDGETHSTESDSGGSLELTRTIRVESFRPAGLQVRVEHGQEIWGEFVFHPDERRT